MNAPTPPLVSCLMPTSGRPQFIAQSIRYFHQQDYPNKELIIVYNKETDLPANLEPALNVKLVLCKEESIGGKRNAGCAQAAGSIIAQWDDDDIYHPTRLSVQAGPLLQGKSEITGLYNFLFYEMRTRCCWVCSSGLFSKLFVENVGGGTLVFLKKVWKECAVYPSISLREDAEFLLAAIKKGARLSRIDGRDIFIYLRHANNTWKFNISPDGRQDGWQRADPPGWMVKYSSFYAGINLPEKTETAPQGKLPAVKPLPFVSCIMPTADRRNLVPCSIAYFLRQNYPHAELIIVDDGKEPVKDLIPTDPHIRYIRLERRMTIGAKRNHACMLAKGDIIVHWDDDDWYAPDWISWQVNVLTSSGADICGLKELFFFAPAIQRAWQYIYPGGYRDWVAGATMAYRRSFWLQHRFRDMQVGEDNHFVWHSPARVEAHSYKNGFVSLLHDKNTSSKHVQDARWKIYPLQLVIMILKDDWRTYKKLFPAGEQAPLPIQ